MCWHDNITKLKRRCGADGVPRFGHSQGGGSRAGDRATRLLLVLMLAGAPPPVPLCLSLGGSSAGDRATRLLLVLMLAGALPPVPLMGGRGSKKITSLSVTRDLVESHKHATAVITGKVALPRECTICGSLATVSLILWEELDQMCHI